MRLINAAGTTNNTWNAAAVLKKARFGAKRDLGVIIAARQLFDESNDFIINVHIETRHVIYACDINACSRVYGLHFGLKNFFCFTHDFGFDWIWIVAADIAEFKLDMAVLWYNVQSCAALDRSCVHGCVRNIVELVIWAFVLKAPCHGLQMRNQASRIFD